MGNSASPYFARPVPGSGTSADPFTSYVAFGDAQVLRHAEIDRAAMRSTGRWIYRVMPSFDPYELPEHDLDQLAAELYAMPYERDRPILVCRGMHLDLRRAWPELQHID